MTDFTRIAVFLDTEFHYSRGIAQGIYRYASPMHQWAIFRRRPREEAVEDIRVWHPSGVIAHAHTRRLAEAVATLGVPVVTTAAEVGDVLPRVGVDDLAVGVLAAEHLLERGFRHTAYVGHPGIAPSDHRASGFAQRLADAGRATPLTTHLVPPQSTGGQLAAQAHLRDWLRTLPRPIGLFAYNDEHAVRVYEACLLEGLRIPDEVAILGVDDDSLLCESAHPPLSSIQIPVAQIGLHAAQLLDGLLAGAPEPGGPIILSPLGVHARGSTDVHAVPDQHLAAALHHIRARLADPLRVEDLLAIVPLSRRSLERRFQEALGRSPLEEIRRARVERACDLLRRTDAPLQDIAVAAGLANAGYLCATFRQATGMTPTAYRRMVRGHHALAP